MSNQNNPSDVKAGVDDKQASSTVARPFRPAEQLTPTRSFSLPSPAPEQPRNDGFKPSRFVTLPGSKKASSDEAPGVVMVARASISGSQIREE